MTFQHPGVSPIIMNKDESHTSTEPITLLSRLLLASERGDNQNPLAGGISGAAEQLQSLASYSSHDLSELWNLATTNHVIMRTFPALRRLFAAQGNDKARWIEDALRREQARIDHALSYLAPICEALQGIGDVIVIKSLDHWPDLGGDLDLYTNAKGPEVVGVMLERFKARVAERSWGDRLANKWNFVVPGLPELVEVHVGRLGQTGEQVAITNSLVNRATIRQLGSHTFPVPANEDRLMIGTLQRMYRHFYIRLCDIADTASLIDAEAIEYPYLKSLAESAGLWAGLATYLTIVSEYVESYRGTRPPLPALVKSAARFGNEQVYFKRRFLRIPIFPQAIGLYASEWERLLLGGEFQNTLRLSLLPPLAAAAALELKLTGSDKGIW